MNKELTLLEVLEKIQDWYCISNSKEAQKDFDIIENALKEYQEIIDTGWKNIPTNLQFLDKILDEYLPNSDTLKDLEKSLKALKIIKEKQVDVGRIILIINTWFDDDFALHRYNDYLENDLDKWKLTKEEFDLLKEVLSNE